MPQDDGSTSSGTTVTLTISDELKAKFPKLIELIRGSESMNDEERQYWVNILPIMTDDQITQLQTILINEKKELKKIDDKYEKDIEGEEESIEEIEQERKKDRENRQEKESTFRKEEEENIGDILEEIENQ